LETKTHKAGRIYSTSKNPCFQSHDLVRIVFHNLGSKGSHSFHLGTDVILKIHHQP